MEVNNPTGLYFLVFLLITYAVYRVYDTVSHRTFAFDDDEEDGMYSKQRDQKNWLSYLSNRFNGRGGGDRRRDNDNGDNDFDRIL